MRFSYPMFLVLVAVFALRVQPAYSQVEFQLNFEAGSGFFDATDWSTQSGGEYSTFGDALRGELQGYFDNVISPTFSYTDSRVLTIDITDDETNAFASAGGSTYRFKEISPNQYVSANDAWDILVNANDPDPTTREGVVNYNLDFNNLYSGSRSSMLNNIAGGLTRHEINHILGMSANTNDHTDTNDPRGGQSFARIYDHQIRDQLGDKIIDGYRHWDGSQWVNPTIANYSVTDDWADDGSGLYFQGIGDNGSLLSLAIDSSETVIDFDHLASSYGGSDRNNSWNPSIDGGENSWSAIIELDRAFYRGMGYSVTSVPEPSGSIIGLWILSTLLCRRKRQITM